MELAELTALLTPEGLRLVDEIGAIADEVQEWIRTDVLMLDLEGR